MRKRPSTYRLLRLSACGTSDDVSSDFNASACGTSFDVSSDLNASACGTSFDVSSGLCGTSSDVSSGLSASAHAERPTCAGRPLTNRLGRLSACGTSFDVPSWAPQRVRNVRRRIFRLVRNVPDVFRLVRKTYLPTWAPQRVRKRPSTYLPTWAPQRVRTQRPTCAERP